MDVDRLALLCRYRSLQALEKVCKCQLMQRDLLFGMLSLEPGERVLA